MNGQWIGEKHSETEGKSSQVVLNVDRIDGRYKGLLFDWHNTQPSICIVMLLDIPADQNPFSGEAILHAYNGQVASNFPFEELSVFAKRANPTITVSRKIYFEGDWNNARLRLSVNTDLGYHAHAILHRLGANAESELKAETLKWADLKEKLFETPYRKFIFRGQSNSRWPLRTSFHREGRAELYRYLNIDIPTMHQRLSSLLTLPMSLGDNDSRGAFVHLLQHHGYPTPLLDWTYSPFVATYFAFRGYWRRKDAVQDGFVRIFKFNVELWTQCLGHIPVLASPGKNLSFLTFQSQNNPRVFPQQAVSSVTSLDDVERYIAEVEGNLRRKFLEAYDIPISEAGKALGDLQRMGITAGSLFPGLDGACEEMRALNFSAQA